MKYRSVLMTTLFLICFSMISAYDDHRFLKGNHLITIQAVAEQPTADISFFVIDLKYNKQQGVKICEVQRGIVSSFSGFDYAYGPTLSMGGRFVEFLEK